MLNGRHGTSLSSLFQIACSISSKLRTIFQSVSTWSKSLWELESHFITLPVPVVVCSYLISSHTAGCYVRCGCFSMLHMFSKSLFMLRFCGWFLVCIHYVEMLFDLAYGPMSLSQWHCVIVMFCLSAFPQLSVRFCFRTYSLSRGTKQYSSFVQSWGLGFAQKASTLPASAVTSAK